MTTTIMDNGKKKNTQNKNMKGKIINEKIIWKKLHSEIHVTLMVNPKSEDEIEAE